MGTTDAGVVRPRSGARGRRPSDRFPPVRLPPARPWSAARRRPCRLGRAPPAPVAWSARAARVGRAACRRRWPRPGGLAAWRLARPRRTPPWRQTPPWRRTSLPRTLPRLDASPAWRCGDAAASGGARRGRRSLLPRSSHASWQACNISNKRQFAVEKSRSRYRSETFCPLVRSSYRRSFRRDRISPMFEWVECALRGPRSHFSSDPGRPVRWEHDGNGTRCQ